MNSPDLSLKLSSGSQRKVQHHAALPYADVGAFMTDLRKCEGVAALALEFAVLTAARTGEVLGATWPEIDLQGRLWTVAGQRMKGGREHRVPLSQAAVAVLQVSRAAVRSPFRCEFQFAKMIGQFSLVPQLFLSPPSPCSSP